jgi:hypothetical protein
MLFGLHSLQSNWTVLFAVSQRFGDLFCASQQNFLYVLVGAVAFGCESIFSNAHNFVKNLVQLYGPRSIAHFGSLEQTCRLHQLSGSGDKYLFFC